MENKVKHSTLYIIIFLKFLKIEIILANPNQTKQSHDNSIENETVTKHFYQIPTRNKHGEIEVLTVLKDNISTVNKITDTTLDEFVSHKKPELQDAPIDQKTKLDLEQLLEKNKDAFAEDERQIGTIPLITMSIDTGDHSPIAKRPYTLALKHHDWVKAETDKFLEAGVIRKSNSSWPAPIVVVPKVMEVKDFVLTIEP